MNVLNLPKDMIKDLVQKGVEKPSKFLMLTSAAGWALSSAAQVGAILINNNVPKKEKRFLIPQEIMDGIINISLFCLFTSKMDKLGKISVLSGRLRPNFMKEMPKVTSAVEPLFKKDLNLNADLKSLDKHYTNIIDKIKKINPDLEKQFKKHYNFCSNTFSIMGSVIAVSIVTPLLRNKIASKLQKTLHKSEPEKKEFGTYTAPKSQVARPSLNTYFNMINKPTGIKI